MLPNTDRKSTNILTFDEQESIYTFTETPGWAALLKWLDSAVTYGVEANVLKYNLSQGSEGLVIAKAQAEGARKSLNYLLELKDKLKQRQ